MENEEISEELREWRELADKVVSSESFRKAWNVFGELAGASPEATEKLCQMIVSVDAYRDAIMELVKEIANQKPYDDLQEKMTHNYKTLLTLSSMFLAVGTFIGMSIDDLDLREAVKDQDWVN